jgi:hypothetical protein
MSLYSDNANYGQTAIDNTLLMLREPYDRNLWDKTLRSLITYAQDLLYAFYGFTALVALVGALVAERRTQALILILLLPAYLGTTVLYLGGVPWGRILMGQLPRLSFGAYPSLYLAAAVALAALEAGLARLPLVLRWPRLAMVARAAPWLVLAAVVVIANIDAFGHPETAYHFYWPIPMSCPPYHPEAQCTPY